MFRQQAASAVELECDKLNSSLYAVTFLAHQSGQGKVCRWCQGTDHSSGECALGLDRASNRTVSPTRTLVTKEFRSAGVSRGKGSAEKICFSWNNGKCRFQPYCRFRHVCSTAGCQEDHRAVDCARVMHLPIDVTPHPPQLGEGGDLTLRLFKCPTSVDKFSIKSPGCWVG